MKYATIPTKDLKVDHRYQRQLDPARVRKIVNEFDPRLLGALEVSRRNGKCAVFDGQHRLAALREQGILEAPCIAHDDLTPQEEANLFVSLQRERRTVTPLDRFKARLFAGDKDAKAIKVAVEDAGYQLARGNAGDPGPLVVRGISTLERIYRAGGVAGLAAMFDLADIWRGEDHATDAMFLEGLFLLLSKYGDRVDAEARKRLGKLTAQVIIRRATGGMLAPGGGGWTARQVILSELRKLAGVRGRPLEQSFFKVS